MPGSQSRDSLAAAQDRLLEQAREAVDGGDTTAFERTSRELFDLVGVLDTQPALRRALSDPALPGDRRAEIVRALLADRVDSRTLDALQGLVRSRWSQPRDLADAVEVLAAQAAFTVAEGARRLDEVEDELFRFGRIVDGEPALRGALTDAGLPNDRKVELVRALLADKATPTTVQLVHYAVVHPRGRTFERSLEHFARLAAARRERLIARVTAARPLTEDQQRRLAEGLARVYGSDVQMQVEVDPSIVGGVVVRVRDEVIDGSVARRFEDARRRLAG